MSTQHWQCDDLASGWCHCASNIVWHQCFWGWHHFQVTSVHCVHEACLLEPPMDSKLRPSSPMLNWKEGLWYKGTSTTLHADHSFSRISRILMNLLVLSFAVLHTEQFSNSVLCLTRRLPATFPSHKASFYAFFVAQCAAKVGIGHSSLQIWGEDDLFLEVLLMTE